MLSVIVPVYNTPMYVRQCIESILNQTYTNLEMIIIDDGSTDESSAICQSLTDDRIHYFYIANGGLSAARNYGIDKAQGEWIAFVDSDDWIDPDMYSKLIQLAEDTHADVCACDIAYEYQDKTVPMSIESAVYRYQNVLEKTICFYAHGSFRNAAWNKIYKRELFKDGFGSLRGGIMKIAI